MCKETESGVEVPQPKIDDDTLLTAQQLAKILGVSPLGVYRWAREGKLPFYLIGDKTQRYTLSAIKEATFVPMRSSDSVASAPVAEDWRSNLPDLY